MKIRKCTAPEIYFDDDLFLDRKIPKQFFNDFPQGYMPCYGGGVIGTWCAPCKFLKWEDTEDENEFINW